MGIWARYQKFKKDRHLSGVAKAARTAKNPKAIREDRWASLQYLCSLDSVDLVLPNLLERFEFSLEHGIQDTREKELAMDKILTFNQESMPYLRERLLETSRIAWIIKMLKRIGTDSEVKEALKGALNFNDVRFDQLSIDKNFDILCYLRDYQLEDFVPKLQRFLSDPDERVRFSTIEVLLEQEDESVVQSMVEHLLLDESVENIRLRQAVMESYANKDWNLRNPSQFEQGKVYPGFVIKGEKIALI